MANWQGVPPGGYYQGQGYPPPNPGYPPPNPGYPQQNFGYPQPNPYPEPGFAPPTGPPPVYPTHPNMNDISPIDEQHMNANMKRFLFNDASIRRGFIRKVYSILMCQLLISTGIISLFVYHKPTKLYVQQHMEIFWICFAATIVLLICIHCSTTLSRKAPWNFMFLFLFTLAESVLLATAASTYNSNEVLLAVGITAAICFALTLFAFQTKIDFTAFSGILFALLVVLLLFGIAATIWNGPIVRLVYSCCGALLFSIYLICDTQSIIGGNRKIVISPEEYIFAALNLYLDIVPMFLHILSIIGAPSHD